MDDIRITKAREAMDNLLMAYSAMIDYSFEGAHEMRAAVMELIHALEHHITQEPSVEIETSYHDEEYNRDSTQKEIVIEDGQFCVYSADRSRLFGCYISRERAEERLAQIESFANRTAELSTDNLMLAHAETRKVLSAQTLVIVNELVEEELFKRFKDTVLEKQEILEPKRPAMTTIVKAEQRYTMGPVYVPNLEDAHGETIEASELQKAIWDWVRNGDRTIYLQHSEKAAGEMVEILTLPMETQMSLIVPTEGVTKYSFPADTPFMGVIWEEWAWELVKAGKLRGYSIGGQAQRVEVDLPSSLGI